MKRRGNADDPFADDGDGRDAGDDSDDEVTEGVATSEPEPASEDTDTTSSSSLPWLYARDNAKAGREMTQFFLQPESEQMESDAVDELEDRFSDNEVRAFDVREAAYQVALDQHLDDVAAKLREWGYDQK